MKYFNIIIEIIIIMSLMLFAIETLPDLTVKEQHLLDLSEIVVVIVFSIEYVVRFIVGKFKYMFSFFGIVDLLSIVPFFIFFIPELSIVKVLRLIRILRIIKLARYADALKKVGRAIGRVKKELIVYMILNFCILYIIAFIMYYIEGGSQPDKFGSVVSPSARPEPFRNCLIRPLRGFIIVAAFTGIGCIDHNTKIRAGNPKAVIRAVIDPHVIPARHVTLDTFGTGADVEKQFTF